MFQYTHELVINSLTTPEGTPVLVQESGKPLVIKRGGEYYKNFIQSQGSNEHVVYRTNGNVGTYETLTINCTKLPTDAGIYQFSMFVKLVDPHALFEFGYPNYHTFGRRILVDYEVESGDNAAAIASKLYEALSTVINKDEFVLGGELSEGVISKFEDGDSIITVTAKHYGLRFDTVSVATYDPTTCDSCIGEYLSPIDVKDNKDASKNAATVSVAGVEPFATGEWIQENLRFPSHYNIRYQPINGDNYPVPGVLYDMFSFAYESPRPGLGGVSGVGQMISAVTRHIYYVRHDLADQFANAFTALGATIVTTSEVEVTNPDANAVSEPAEPSEP